MKSIYQNLCTILLLLPLFSSAQDLSNFDTVAHYTLINTDVDQMGNYANIQLINTPYAGADGVYSNGNYIGGDPDSSHIQTPFMAALHTSNFAVRVEFKLESLNNPSNMPIINCGAGWRYLGFELHYDNYWLFRVNNYSYEIPNLVPEADKWYTLTIVHDSVTTKSSFYLDNNLVAERTAALIRPDDEGDISATNGGTGKTFKGHWRNLRVYTTEPTSGIVETAFEAGLEVFPNPTSWGLQIKSDYSSTCLIQVFALDGQLILEDTMTSGNRILQFPKTMNPGIYIIRLQGTDGQVAHRRVELLR